MGTATSIAIGIAGSVYGASSTAIVGSALGASSIAIAGSALVKTAQAVNATSLNWESKLKLFYVDGKDITLDTVMHDNLINACSYHFDGAEQILKVFVYNYPLNSIQTLLDWLSNLESFKYHPILVYQNRLTAWFEKEPNHPLEAIEKFMEQLFNENEFHPLLRCQKLLKSFITKVLCHHFIMFQTKNHWWSVEKFQDALYIQRFVTKAKVLTEMHGAKRIHDNDLILQDMHADGGIKVKDLFVWLHEKDLLKDKYHIMKSNCKHFAKACFIYLQSS